MRAMRRVAMQGVNLAALDTVFGKLWLRKAPNTTGANTTWSREGGWPVGLIIHLSAFKRAV